MKGTFMSVHPEHTRGSHSSTSSISGQRREGGGEELAVVGDRMAKSNGDGLEVQAQQTDEAIPEIGEGRSDPSTLVS